MFIVLPFVTTAPDRWDITKMVNQSNGDDMKNSFIAVTTYNKEQEALVMTIEIINNEFVMIACPYCYKKNKVGTVFSDEVKMRYSYMILCNWCHGPLLYSNDGRIRKL